MRSATGIELDPRGSLALHEFRWPAADHELGQDASGISYRSARIIGKEARTFRGRPRLSLDRYYTVAHGEDESLQSRRNFELGEDVSHVGVNRSHAHV